MIWFGAAVVLHIGLGFFYLLSGLLAPLWAVGILVVIWVTLAVLLIRTRSNGPRDLWAPAVAAAIWLGAMSAGERFLEWSA